MSTTTKEKAEVPKEVEEKPFEFDIHEAYAEFKLVQDALECHHALFFQLADLGQPQFTERVPTAGVGFSHLDDKIDFMWNPKFWASCNFDEKVFITAHECMHVYLSHGKRGKDCTQPQLANVAMDVVVNEMLVDFFGFDRTLLHNVGESMVWLDTTFDANDTVLYDQSFEYYYDALTKKIKDLIKQGKIQIVPGGSGSGGMTIYPGDELGDLIGETLDDHSRLTDFDDKIEKKISQRISKTTSNDEKDSFKELTESDSNDDGAKSGDESGPNGKQAGTVAGQSCYYVPKPKVKYNCKWTDIIKYWRIRHSKPQEIEESWAWPNRRIPSLGSGNKMFLPTERSGDQLGRAKKTNVWFFMDTSGSCVHMKDKFFDAATQFPLDKFDLVPFCFDTKVYEIDLKTRKLYGFGGTYFHIIEEAIQRKMKKDNVRYPDAVFVFTDGYGDSVYPEKPDRWFWFLDGYNSKHCIPQHSRTFDLDDFHKE